MFGMEMDEDDEVVVMYELLVEGELDDVIVVTDVLLLAIEVDEVDDELLSHQAVALPDEMVVSEWL